MRPGTGEYARWNSMIETIIDAAGSRVTPEETPDILVTLVDRVGKRRIANQRQLAELLAVNGIPHEVARTPFSF